MEEYSSRLRVFIHYDMDKPSVFLGVVDINSFLDHNG